MLGIIKNTVLIMDCMILAAAIYMLSGVDWFDEDDRSVAIGFVAIALAIIGNIGLLIIR